jgi:3-oxoacyl-[acyl-carrier-protein] synthase-3
METRPDSVLIRGTGAYYPETVVTNDDLAARVDTSDEWIRTRTGIRERRFAGPGEATSDMAAAAGREALQAAGIAPGAVDLVVVATMTPDMPFPSTACLVQAKLGLSRAAAFDLQAACSGFVYGLSVVTGLLRGGEFKTVLLIGAEKMSAVLDFQDRATCVLFGDGAGAAVLTRDGPDGAGILGSITGADGSTPGLLCQPGGGSTLPPTPESLAARQHFLKMNGREVFKSAVRVMAQACTDLLDRYGRTPGELDLIIPHQANMRIIDSLSKRLGIGMDRFHNNLDRFGNTSAASVPIALDEAVRAGRLRPGDLLLLVAFGAGLTWGASLIKWT